MPVCEGPCARQGRGRIAPGKEGFMPLTEDGQVYRSLPATLKNLPWHRRRKANRYGGEVAAIENLAPVLRAEPDDRLQERAASLRERAGNGAPVDGLLVETFALVRETAR